jgi:hypothetical protein
MHRWQKMVEDFQATQGILQEDREDKTNSVDKFKSIFLYNIIYKKKSKVISNKLKSIMSCMTSHEQGGYIEGHQILDGIIVSHEAIHSLKSTKKPSMLIKLNMPKAYDCLNWDFSVQMLTTFSFSLTWVKWVKNLISSTFFYFLVMVLLPPYSTPLMVYVKETLFPHFFSHLWKRGLEYVSTI